MANNLPNFTNANELSVIEGWFADDKILSGMVKLIFSSDTLAPIGAMNTYVTSIILTVAAAFLMYNVVAGTAQTAHEGQILGQRWNSLWAPVRVLFGAGGLIPVNGGMVIIQWFVIYVVLFGLMGAVNLHMIGFNAYMDKGTLVSFGVNPELKNTVKSYAKQELCQLYFNDALLAANTPDKRYYIKENIVAETQRDIRGFVNGDLDSEAGVASLAGSILSVNPYRVIESLWNGNGVGGVYRVTQPRKYSFDLVEQNNQTGQSRIIYSGFCGAVKFDQKVYNQPAVLPILDAHMRAAINARSNIKNAVKTYYEAKYTAAGGVVDEAGLNASKEGYASAIIAYDAEVRAEVGKAIGSMRKESNQSEGLRKLVSEYGYLGAGATWMIMSMLQQEAYDATQAIPNIDDPSPSVISGNRLFGKDALMKYQRIATGLALDNIDIAETIMAMKGPTYGDVWDKYSPKSEIVAWGTWAGMEEGEAIKRALKDEVDKEKSSTLSAQVALFFLDLKFDDVLHNPMAFVGQVGNYLLATAAAFVAGGTLLEFFTGVGAGGVAIGVSIFVAGFMCTVAIPIMILVGWLLAVIFWIVQAISFIIGSLLWALAHMSMDGDGFAGNRGAHGWNALLEITLKPIFQVFFLHITLYLVPFFIGIAIITVSLAFKLAIATSTGGILFTIGLIMALTASIVFIMLHVVLGFQNKADDMFKYIGISAENNPYAAPGADKAAAAMAGGAMYAGRNAGAPIREAGKRYRKNREVTFNQDEELGG